MSKTIYLSNALHALITDEDLTDEKLREASEGLLPNLDDYLNGVGVGTPDGLSLIIRERKRQIEEEGFTSKNDDEYQNGELALAASSYVLNPSLPPSMLKGDKMTPFMWPWLPAWWKPTPDDRIRELVKAGALIAAEIDRLQRSNS